MKINIKLSVLFLYPILFQNTSAQNWFPLEVGNRWDYFVQIDFPGSTVYDTLSISILDQKILPNGLEYYEFSSLSTPWYILPYSKYIRVENNEIYFFDEEDSTDCFAFRFDLGIGGSYVDCKNNEILVEDIDSALVCGNYDLTQWQSTSGMYYIFSKRFGISEYFDFSGLVRPHYHLKGCIISGIIYGDLLVRVENENQLPDDYNLFQNYPNPFNPSTMVKFTISDLRFTTLKVYDILGNQIVTLVNEEKPAGEYEVEFDGTGLPSGIYFYQLKAGDFIETNKMVLIK